MVAVTLTSDFEVRGKLSLPCLSTSIIFHESMGFFHHDLKFLYVNILHHNLQEMAIYMTLTLDIILIILS